VSSVVSQPPPTPLESVTRTALLGARFFDRVSGQLIADGLQVVETTTGTAAFSGPSGVFVVHDLPGLRASAFGSGDDAFWSSPPVEAPFVFQLTDTQGRFLPFVFTAEVPLRGLFADDCGIASSPPDATTGSVPLFSTPSRVAPAGIAAVRADLKDAETGAEASWAVLEVSINNAAVYRGVADEHGRVAVLMPYPKPPWLASPPPGSRALSDQTWPVTVSVRYGRPASPPFPDPASGEPPDLCAVLTQPTGTLLASASPEAPLGAQTLLFGRELVLRTGTGPDLLVLSA